VQRIRLCDLHPAGFGPGDSAFCSAPCTKHDDCQNPFVWCSGNNFADTGYCASGDPCPGGMADCKVPSQECIETKYGPKCLDPQFDLGTAAP